jgi:type IX secretion system PorP/SprF family membrane protein
VCDLGNLCSASSITITVTNTPPIIADKTFNTSEGSIKTIDVLPLISDAENNISLSTIEIVGNVLSGAKTTIETKSSSEINIVLDYTGLSFSGADEIRLKVCDATMACTEKAITILVEGNSSVEVYNAVAPNSSGDNRFMRIINLPTQNKVQIFNRWGDEVFSVLINPAYSGFNNQFNVSSSYRKQLRSVCVDIKRFRTSIKSCQFNNKKMGAGLVVLQDKIGSAKNTEVHATYSYRLDLKKKYFSFGLQAGVVNFKNGNSNLNIYDPTDPAFYGTVNTTKPSFGAGAILHSDRYFIGTSVPRLLKAQTPYNSFEGELYTQHFYGMASYNIFINEHVRLKPSVLLRGVKGAKLSTDLNVVFNFNEKYTAGVFSRNFNTYGLLAQMKLGEKYRFGYVFEVPTNSSVGSRFTSHEITFGINLAAFKFQDQMAVTTF